MMVDGQWNYPLVLWKFYSGNVVLKKSLLKQKVYLWTWIWINFCGTFCRYDQKKMRKGGRERVSENINHNKHYPGGFNNFLSSFITEIKKRERIFSSARNKERGNSISDRRGCWMMDMMELINSNIVHYVEKKIIYLWLSSRFL